MLQLTNTSATDRVVALFAYTAQHSDELTFKKDDIITVIERGADPDWWKGEVDGHSGLFPANYVRPLSADCMLLFSYTAPKISTIREY